MVSRTSQDIRCLNRFEVLRHLYGGDEARSRQELATATGLSFATVANLTSELLEAGVLVEAGRAGSGGGRPRALLTLNAERGALIGVDVAEASVRVELFDLALRELHVQERPLPPDLVEPAQVVQEIAAGIDAVLAATDTPAEHVLGAGVSVPGLVEREGGVSAYSPYWAWRQVPLRALLAEHVGIPLYLDNPLKASTVAEMWFGAGREVDDLVVVTLRTGVGAGFAVGGALYRGFTNSAGEWGHTCLELDGRLCRCGSRGCVEAYVGTRGVVETLRAVAPDDPLLDTPDGAGVLRALARRAADGEPVAEEVVERTGRYLGAAVANLVNLLNPEVLVLGNQVAEQLGEPLLARTRAAVDRHALAQPLRAVDLRLSTLPENAVSRGAATFALEGFLNNRELFGSVSRARASRGRGGNRTAGK
ncbi:ROK family protein [Streptomyces sp. NA04227]|uniref:ROK family protein n=1 Tax=Streptomyces sp. NA04227 TaxID=2742136 RepID=UPI0015921BD9|nr:ROK family protein [Streptomyces sp. NA04227]QKW09826.1 ROK family protein [Streptomyces sp. NA04227]